MVHSKVKTIPLTPKGYQQVQTKIQKLEKYREEVLVKLQAAREMGDLSENGAYQSARFELSGTDRELKKLRYLSLYGQPTQPSATNSAGFGNQITLANSTQEITFTLVSDYEADPKAKLLSLKSPYGQACAGKQVGDQVVVHAPSGLIKFKIKAIT